MFIPNLTLGSFYHNNAKGWDVRKSDKRIDTETSMLQYYPTKKIEYYLIDDKMGATILSKAGNRAF